MPKHYFSVKLIVSLFMILFLTLASLSCGGSNDNFVGTWQGTTSQGAQLAFQVQPQKTNTNTPNVFCFGFNVTDSQFRSLATGCDSNALIFPVRGNTFSINHRVNQVTVFTVSGQFLSSTSATGQIVDTAGPTPVNLTWTATRQP
jgi:hypothetical protein